MGTIIVCSRNWRYCQRWCHHFVWIVDNYAEKVEAEKATKNVISVKAIAQKIKLHYGHSFTKNDNDIANEVLNAWKWRWEIPHDDIKVKKEDGWVTLEGQLEWNYQKEAAQKAVQNLTRGKRGIKQHYHQVGRFKRHD